MDPALPEARRNASHAIERLAAAPTPAFAFLRVSLIVPVRDRSSALARLLDAVAAQSLANELFEVLVCDDGSSDGEAPAIESLVMKARAEHDLTVAYLRQPRKGAGAARNLGLAHARADLVAFTDSDCLPDRDWLALIAAAFDDPAIGMVGGPAEYRGAATFGGRCANFLMTTTLGAGGARDPRSRMHVKFYPRSYNLAVRRELALAVGGFPAACYGEDIEFSQRIAALGGRVAFVPDARVVHDERRSPRETVVQSFKKGFKRVETARRCGTHNVLYAAPAALLTIFAVWVALFLARSPLAAWAGAPLLAYVASMVGLGVYGGFAMWEPAAVAAIPCYAVLIHTAYALGYWGAIARRGGLGVEKNKSKVQSPKSEEGHSSKIEVGVQHHREADASRSPTVDACHAPRAAAHAGMEE